MTGTDNRGLMLGEFPVFRKSIDQMSWATGAGHVAKTEAININGSIKQICIRASSVTDNPTITVTLTDANGNILYSSGAIADGTDYVYTPTDFSDPILCTGSITVSVDPSADAGGAGQVLTVDVDIYGD